MRFDEGATDRLIGVALLTEGDDVLLATRQGKAIRFAATDVREFQSRTSTGVRGMTLKEDDEVISLSILHRVGTKQEEREDYLRLDRKSVVSGKSVSVRVDLGGRRIIKKNMD